MRSYLTTASSLLVYTSTIRSKLEYCSNVLFCSNLASISSDLERCQRRAVRAIFNVSRNSGSDIFSVTEACDKLQLLTLNRRRTERFNALAEQLAAGKGSPYLVKLLNDCGSHGRSLRNACAFILPSTRSNFGRKRPVFNLITALKG